MQMQDKIKEPLWDDSLFLPQARFDVCVSLCDCRGELCNNIVTEDYMFDDNDQEHEQLDRNIFDLFD